MIVKKSFLFLLFVMFLTVFLSAKAQHQVTWKNISSLTIEQDHIKKISGWSWSNGGALSRNKLRANTDGKMTYVIKGTETLMMVGLSELNDEAHANSIDYAMYYCYGDLKVWESGANRGTYGSLNVGDTLVVSREGDSIKYERHNMDGSNAQLRTVATDASKELYVDLSIYYPNLAVNHVYCDFDEELTIWDSALYYHNVGTGRLGNIDVTVTGYPPYNFSWSNGATTEDISGLTAGDFTLTVTDARQDTAVKTYKILSENTYPVKWGYLENFLEYNNELLKPTYYKWDGGALSTNKLEANENGNVKYVYTGNERRFMLGLSEYNQDPNYTSIQHRIYAYYATIMSETRTVGDTIVIERLDSTVYFKLHKIDGTQKLLKSESTDPSKVLYVDLSAYDPGARINNNVICSFEDGLSIRQKILNYENITANTLGNIEVQVTGKAPLSYSWSNGATTKDVSGLVAGTYTLTVTDGLGISMNKSFEVRSEETYPVNWRAYNNFTLNPASNELTKPTYYNWDAKAVSTNKLPANTNGRFKYVYSGNERRFTLGLSPSSTLSETTQSADVEQRISMSTASISYMPRSIGDTIILERIDSTVYYRFHTIGGEQYLLFTKPCDPSEELYVYVSGFDPGLTINSFTCSFEDGVSIRQNVLNYQNITANTLGSIDVEVTGKAPLSYSWSNGVTTEDVSGLVAGSYTLTVTDGTGESTSKTFEIRSEETYPVNWRAYNNFILNPASNVLTKRTWYAWDAKAVSTNKLPANANGRFKYVYSGNERRFTLGLSPSSTLSETTQSADVEQRISMSNGGIAYIPRSIGDTIILERIDSTVYYRFHTIGGEQYLLFTKPCDPSEELYAYVSGYDPGLTINNFACSFEDGLSIRQNELYHQNITANTLGSINVEVTGKAPFSYSWSNGTTTEDVSELQAGTYTLIVTDGTGETLSKSFEIEAEPNYLVKWQNIQNYTLESSTNILTSTGGAQWSSGALSINKLPSNTDGKIFYEVHGNEHHAQVGFAEYNNIATHTSILHKQYIYNNGLGYSGPLSVGDLIVIERKGDKIIHRRHNIDGTQHVLFSETTDPSKELYVDISSRYANRNINHIYCTFGIENEKCGPTITLSQDSICSGDYTELVVNTQPTNDYDDYLFTWSPSNSISTTSTPLTYAANPASSTDYVLQYEFYNASGEVICSSEIIKRVVVDGKECDEHVENEEQEIVGCCFGNFGAGVYVGSQTNLNVYCNVLNEIGGDENGSIVQGEFLNKGEMNVELDWIHNAQNEMFISDEGSTSLIGEEQQLRGNSSTHFYNLELEGNNSSKKVLIDEYIKNILQLNDNELATIDDIVFVENNDENAILRGTGYVSTDGIGAINRALANNAQVYLFPMGSQQGTYRYRPVIVNNSVGQNFQVNFQNSALPTPALDPVEKAPNVQSLNTDYYYKLNSDQNDSNLELTLFYPTNEGPYQSIAQWRTLMGSTQSRWEMSPNPSATTIPSMDNNTFGMLSSSTVGIQDYISENFTLSSAGFYVNTGDLNGGDDGSSLVITVSNANDNNGNGIDDVQEGNANGTDANNDGIDDYFQTGTDTDGDGISDAFDANPNGGSSTGGGLNNPNISSNDDQTFAPSPVAGTYNMNIASNNNCVEEGTVQFTVDNNGNIVDESDVKFIPSGVSQTYYLSNSVFETDNVASGLILNATPESALAECVNNLQIKMGPNEPFILSISSSNTVVENIEIISPTSGLLTNAVFKIYKSATLEFSQQLSGNNIISASSILPAVSTSWTEGAYDFELEVTYNGATEIIKGQFIIKE